MSKLQFILTLNVLFFISSSAFCQNGFLTEASVPETDAPLDGIVEKRLMKERPVLAYQPIREADIFWEKKIWRVIDVREKINKPFAYPDAPFFSIITDAISNGDVNVYSTEDDKFTQKLTMEEAMSKTSSSDTITVFDPETYSETVEVVHNDINPEDVQRYRLKEIWFFDENTSTMNVRILGIAPLINVNDDQGNFRYEQPMFWLYYPEFRSILAHHQAFNDGNDASPISWEDMFEMRFFSSYIYQESDVMNRRLKDYLSGVDLLLEADKIKNEIFNFEHDLWTY